MTPTRLGMAAPGSALAKRTRTDMINTRWSRLRAVNVTKQTVLSKSG